MEALTTDEYSALKFSLGMESGDVIPNTGGARKLRWAIGAQGKRGDDMPLVLFAVYKKGRKDDLTER
jgi:hypothetical protein